MLVITEFINKAWCKKILRLLKTTKYLGNDIFFDKNNGIYVKSQVSYDLRNVNLYF